MLTAATAKAQETLIAAGTWISNYIFILSIVLHTCFSN